MSDLKAERIRRAARDLFSRRGFQSVTVSEIADFAQVGKGTVYLYWRTKEDMILDVCVREFVSIMDRVIEALCADPGKIAPHKFIPYLLRAVQNHPILAAFQAHDSEVLALMGQHPDIRALLDTVGPIPMLQTMLAVLRPHGLVRTDLPVQQQVHAASGLLIGIFHLHHGYPGTTPPGFDGEAEEVLGHASKFLLEPAILPENALIKAAAEAVDILKRARDDALSRIICFANRAADTATPVKSTRRRRSASVDG